MCGDAGPRLLAARSWSPWIPVSTVSHKGCGRSQPVTAELRNAGGESPPQMKPLNYHAINMQTSAKLGLNQISHWGLSGGRRVRQKGATRGGPAGNVAAGPREGLRWGTRQWRGVWRPLESAVAGVRPGSHGGEPGSVAPGCCPREAREGFQACQ